MIDYLRTLQITIRPYVEDDCQALITVINQLCAEGRWMYTMQFKPTPAWNYALNAPSSLTHLLLVVTTKREEIVGWCDLLPADAPGTVVLGMGLLADYRDRRIGTAMMKEALCWAHQNAIECMSLVVRTDNARAVHLYDKFEFTTVGQIEPPFPADGQWIAMERKRPFAPCVPLIEYR